MPYKDLEKRREFQREQMRRLRKDNPEKYGWHSPKNEKEKEYHRVKAAKHYKKLCKENPTKLMFNRAKTKAKQKGLKFNLEITDIIIPEFCPYLGIKLKKGSGIVCDTSPTLDKIYPKKGYVKGNIQVISAKANGMKYTASFKDFEKMYLSWKSMNEGVII